MKWTNMTSKPNIPPPHGQDPAFDAMAEAMRAVAVERDFALRRISDLEAILGEARLQIEYLQEKFQPTGTGNAVLARINAALAGKA